MHDIHGAQINLPARKTNTGQRKPDSRRETRVNNVNYGNIGKTLGNGTSRSGKRVGHGRPFSVRLISMENYLPADAAGIDTTMAGLA